MAFTQEQLTQLEEAIASGTLRVRYADRDVTFHSLKEMRTLRSQMQTELGLAAGRPRRKRTMRVYQSGRGQ